MTEHQNYTPATERPYGSVEKALAGQVVLSVVDVIREAWKQVSGNKGTVWLALVIMVAASIFASWVFKIVLAGVGIHVADAPALSFAYIVPSIVLMPILSAVITTPLVAGLSMLSIKIASDQPHDATDVVKYYPYWLNLFITYVVMYVLMMIGFCLFVLPGIYLSVAYVFALPLVVEKNMSPWQALETSRKAVTHQWFQVFGIYLLFIPIMLLGVFTLFIGFIWIIPLMCITAGVVYRRLFGLETSLTVAA